jgi:hypothetical protein
MKNVLIGIASLVFISGCSTSPSSSKPEEGKYAVQIIEAQIPSSSSISKSDLPYGPELVNEILRSPDIKRKEYPIAYADMGETAIVDQTTSKMLPDDYSMEDGKVVAHEREHKLGTYFSAEILEAKENATTIALNFKFKQLAGYDTYSLDDKANVIMPMFQTRSMNNTKITLENSKWMTMSGLVNRDSDGNEYTWIFLVRIIPPKT